MKHNFIEDELIIFTKYTSDVFLKDEKPTDVVGLYWFYYYTAKWQKTNQPKSTTEYTSRGLRWSKGRVVATKKRLIKLGLIEDVITKNSKGQVDGWYIKMNYIFKNHWTEKPVGGFNQWEENSGENALSTDNKNALSTNNKNAYSSTNVDECQTDEIKQNIQKIYSHYKEKIYPTARLTSKGKKQIATRLKEYSVEELFKAMDCFSKNSWYMKQCGWRGIPWFFNSEDKIEQYMNIKPEKKGGKMQIIT